MNKKRVKTLRYILTDHKLMVTSLCHIYPYLNACFLANKARKVKNKKSSPAGDKGGYLRLKDLKKWWGMLPRPERYRFTIYSKLLPLAFYK